MRYKYMQGTGLGHGSGHNTKCDIEIGQVPSCAKCCILRKSGGKAGLGCGSVQRDLFLMDLDCHLAVYVLLSRAK